MVNYESLILDDTNEKFLIQACINLIEMGRDSGDLAIGSYGQITFDASAEGVYKAYFTLISQLERFPKGKRRLRKKIIKLYVTPKYKTTG